MFNLTNPCGFMAYTDAVSGGTGAGPSGGGGGVFPGYEFCALPSLLAVVNNSPEFVAMPALEGAFTFAFYATHPSPSTGGDRGMIGSANFNGAGTWLINLYGNVITFFGPYMSTMVSSESNIFVPDTKHFVVIAREAANADVGIWVDGVPRVDFAYSGTNNLTDSGNGVVGAAPYSVAPFYRYPFGGVLEDVYLCNGGYYPPN